MELNLREISDNNECIEMRITSGSKCKEIQHKLALETAESCSLKRSITCDPSFNFLYHVRSNYVLIIKIHVFILLI